MGLRLRRSIRLLPGVRLNLGLHGASVTLGPRGASVNIGSRGTHLNLGVPGTGLSFRSRLDDSPSQFWSSDDHALLSTEEHRSGPSGSLTGGNLRELAALMTETARRRRRLSDALSEAEHEHAESGAALQRAHRSLFEFLERGYVAALAEHHGVMGRIVDDLRGALTACKLHAEFELDDRSREGFRRLVDAFARLSASERIWDVSATMTHDRVKTRSFAADTIIRSVVRFGEAKDDLLPGDGAVLHLANANGGDISIYPPFVLVRAPDDAVDLVDLRDVVLTPSETPFLETGSIPRDSKVTGSTWSKVNKDGTRDRRFAYNFEIPIVTYGSLVLSSSSGLNESYLVSDAGATRFFAESFDTYKQCLPTATDDSPERDGDDDDAELMELPNAEVPVLPQRPRRPILPRLVVGMSAVWLLLLGARAVGNGPSGGAMRRTPSPPSRSVPLAERSIPAPSPPPVEMPSPSTAPIQAPVSARPLDRQQIIEAQRLLQQFGFGVGAADGIPGLRTRAAVRSFQSAAGLSADGALDTRVLDALRQRRNGR